MSGRCWSPTVTWLVPRVVCLPEFGNLCITGNQSRFGILWLRLPWKGAESLTEPLWVTTPASSLRKGCYGDDGQTCNNYGSLATAFRGCHRKLLYSSSATTCVKFVLPFIAGLVLSIFSFSAEIKLIQREGKFWVTPKLLTDLPLIRRQRKRPLVMSIRHICMAESQSRRYESLRSWHSSKAALQHQPPCGAWNRICLCLFVSFCAGGFTFAILHLYQSFEYLGGRKCAAWGWWIHF